MERIGRTIRRRRREGKTDYKSRFNFLKSGKDRVVFRKSNRYIIGQIIISEIAQDKAKVTVTSKDLLTLGWPKEMAGSLKSLPACYLTGYLTGKKSGIKEAIFDIGLLRNVHKSRIYAFLKGLKDSGVEISCKEEVLPTEEEINKNEKTGKLIKQIKEKIK